MIKQAVITLLISLGIYNIGLAEQTSNTTPLTEAETVTVNHDIIVSPLTKHSDTKAYMNIYDTSDHDVVLVAATSPEPIAKQIQLHRYDAVVHKMAPVKTIKIPHNGETSLHQRSYHIMFIDLTRGLHKGEHVPIILIFEDGSYKMITATVE